MNNSFPSERKSLSLRKAITAIVLIGYCSLLILLMLLDFFLIRNYQINKREKESEPLQSYVEKIETEMDIIRKIVYDTYAFDQNFSVLSRNPNAAEKFSNAYDLRQTLESFMSIDNYLHGFYIFYDKKEAPLYQINTKEVKSSQSSQLGKALRVLYEATGENRVSGWSEIEIENELYLVVSCYKGNAALFGILNINSILDDSFQEEGITSHISANGKLVSEENRVPYDLVELIEQNGEKTMFGNADYQVYGMGISGTTIWIYTAYHSGIYSYISNGQICLLVFTAFSVFAALWIVRVLHKNLILPLRELYEEIQEIREGTKTNTVPIRTCFYELQEVNDTLDETIEKLEKQKLISYEHYIEKQKAQMQYLQLQIQPHFYLNGLKVINGLVLKGDVEKTQSYIISLSEHLRYLMQVDSEVTTLLKEIEFTKNYVFLRNQMSQRPISVCIEKDEDIIDCIVPTLLIQTFVDNSIKHAKFGSPDIRLEIHIIITCLQLENEKYLDLQVCDNGNGYEEEMLRILNEEPKPGEKHIGISNLIRRCRIMYGEKAEFSFSNQEGAHSECIIPLQEVSE